MKKLICVVAAMLLVFMPATVQAWGPEGHEIVGTLAQAMLSDRAKAGVQLILGTATLASVSNWADQIRQARQETYNWHFVDIPRSATTFDDSRDCFLPNDAHPGAATDHMNCVVDRITFFKQVLTDMTKTPTERQEALQFIVHFVGDVHQPFHAVGDARGGNDNLITEFGSTQCGTRPCNLHSAWDSGMITHTGMDVNAYTQHLQQLIMANHMTASGNPADWANESHAAGQTAWIDNGGVLDDAYYNTQIQVVDTRLALAGLRLAAVLEDVFGGGVNPTQTGSATRNLKLRPDASSAHRAIETIQKGATLTLLETNQTNNYYHVTAADGKAGWVLARYVKLQ
jgi:nuclease S1